MTRPARPLVLLAAVVVLSGCCGRGLWYSSPSRSCALDLPGPATLPA